jgi:uncharacterized repeat protein (TIGR03803 family)
MKGKPPLIQQTARFSLLALLAGALFATAVLPTPARAQTYTVLHTFEGTDGGNSSAKLVRDSAGNLYGTTSAGGDPTCNCGTVFKLDKRGHLTTLYTFKGAADGFAPIAPLVRDASGNLYGTTNSGGNLNQCIDIVSGCGVVFKIDKMGHETVLHTFTDGADGARPNGLIRDTAGNLYGTAQAGGDQSCTDFSPVGCGTVFKLNKNGRFSVLYTFVHGTQDGRAPWAGVVRDGAGNLYGTTTAGGTSDFGIVFKLNSRGKEIVLHNFTGYPNDGNDPRADLTLDAAGNLYGTTFFGGSGGGGEGTVFKVDKHGRETVLYNYVGVSKRRLPHC